MSAAASQTQPHTPPLFWNLKPTAQEAVGRHWQVHAVVSHCWNPVQVPPQSEVQTKSQTRMFGLHTLPSGALPPQLLGHSQRLVEKLQASFP